MPRSQGGIGISLASEESQLGGGDAQEQTRGNFSEPATCVGEIIDRAAAHHGDRWALVVGDARVTYSELRRQARALAAGLLAHGLTEGERVCLFAPNLIESYIALFATAMAGAVFVPVNPRLRPRELEDVLVRSRATALLFVPEWAGFDYIERLEPLFGNLRTGASTSLSGDVRVLVALQGSVSGATGYEELLRDGDNSSGRDALQRASATVRPENAALLQFTSGTTSAPKAALLAHQPIARMGFELGRRFGLSPTDHYFGCPPICHLGGTAFSLIAATSHAATFVTLPVFEAASALRTIEQERCTVLHGVDSHLRILMSHSEFVAERLPVRLVSVSGVAQTVQDVDRAFNGPVVISQYGSTELGGGPVCAGVEDSRNERLTSVGRPLPGIEVSIHDPETEEQLASGDTGEIRIRGWSTMLGYEGQPNETAALLDSSGRMKTGDLGYLDVAGFLHFTGRLKNILRTGGESVAMEEVESVIARYPGVGMVSVVGVTDARLGEVGYAFVVPDGSVAIEEAGLREHCMEELAKFKVPRYFEISAEAGLPMTGSGKVDRQTLISRARTNVPG